MSHAPRRIVVTGAGGFIGRRLVAELVADAAFADTTIMACDRELGGQDLDRVVAITGDIADQAVRAELAGFRPDCLIHLAGILGGAAEADYDLARRVNIDATLSLIEAVRDADAPPRVVFASSIAVFGPPLPPLVDDDTLPLPVMTYGAQKRMIEVVIEQFSARGWIDGIALRLPGIVARPGADARLKSAFLHTLFDAVADGRDNTLPVAAQGTTWLLSTAATVDALVHAALVPADRLGRRRAMTLPAQNVRFGDLVAALHRHCPASAAKVDYAPDPAIVAQFGAQPPLVTPIADALGFRHDGDLATLVARAVLR